jgi:hypothetical protein
VKEGSSTEFSHRHGYNEVPRGFFTKKPATELEDITSISAISNSKYSNVGRTFKNCKNSKCAIYEEKMSSA